MSMSNGSSPRTSTPNYEAKSTSNFNDTRLNDLMPSFHLESLKNTVPNTISNTASMLFSPLTPRAVKGDAVTIITEFAPQMMERVQHPLHVKDCNNVPQTNDCRRPIRILGPEETILAWNMDDNTLLMNSTYNAKNTEWCYFESNFEDAILVHPYGRPGPLNTDMLYI
ncbi:peripheral protein of the cytosolic face of the mitochondrial outer membrane [Gigaspora margarita]|uniref:Peripheral protein of the cytosolic face of the mitochondrial outer membrane n=1 Tax=Gigaspora margarita TaxID=4874 RepID=A0A8H3XBE5_GIGMA|nr:peripheral protein of the cytosolic face of the mitochondrial outer membrane [Gigaspora margarita]